MSSFLKNLGPGSHRGATNSADSWSKVLLSTGLSLIVASAGGFYYTLQPTPNQVNQQIDVGQHLLQVESPDEFIQAESSLEQSLVGDPSPSASRNASRPHLLSQTPQRPMEVSAEVQSQLIKALIKTHHLSKKNEQASFSLSRVGYQISNSQEQSGPAELNINIYDKDEKSKALPGITVTLVAVGTTPNIRKRSAVTGSRGEVSFSNLPMVRYKVTAESADYQQGHDMAPFDRVRRFETGMSMYMELKRRQPAASTPTLRPSPPPSPVVSPKPENHKLSPGRNGQLIVDCPKEISTGWKASCQVTYKPPLEGTPPDLVGGYTTLAAFKLIETKNIRESQSDHPFKPLDSTEQSWDIPVEPDTNAESAANAKLIMQVKLKKRDTGEVETPRDSEVSIGVVGSAIAARPLTRNQSLGGSSLLAIAGMSLVGIGRAKRKGYSRDASWGATTVGFGLPKIDLTKILVGRNASLNLDRSDVREVTRAMKGRDLVLDLRETLIEVNKDLADSSEVLGSVERRMTVDAGDADRAPTTTQYKRINAWIAEHADEPEKPLEVDAFCTLNLNVGEAVASTLIAGPSADVPLSDIPDEGLDTEWLITSGNVSLQEIPGDSKVKVTEKIAAMISEARFSLQIPQIGDSELRQVRVRPETLKPELRIIVYANDRIYRQFKIELKVISGDKTYGPDASATITGEVIHMPGKYTALRPPHEWQTPPGDLDIVVFGGGNAHCKGETPKGVLDTTFQWKGAQASVKGPITNLRKKAETYRETFSDELNDVDGKDLNGRLARLKQSPGDFEQDSLAHVSHAQVWDQKIAKSKELYEVAYYGYQLYQKFFPDDTPVRKALDSLDTGWRVNISWSAQSDQSWVPNVPWGLFYKEPPVNGQAIDPLNFWGLRFRINYSAHAIENPQSPTLGSLQQTIRGYGLYWGKEEREIADEVIWQQTDWTQWANQKFVPDNSDTTTPRDQLLALLNKSGQQPMPHLYLFCQCDVGDGSEPVLRFGNSKHVADNIRETDLDPTKFRDQPLVFVNACSSAGSDPYVANQLEETFFTKGCRAYLGTEIKVPIRLASRFATIFYHFFYRSVDPAPMAAGEAVYQTRRFLWREYRNLGGLFYTYINQYELYMATDAELSLPHR